MPATLTRIDGDIWMLVRDHRKLARLLLIQDVSHRQLADALGWKSHSYIGRLCRGQVRSVDSDVAIRIAHLLQVSVDDLFVVKVSTKSGQIDQKEPDAA